MKTPLSGKLGDSIAPPSGRGSTAVDLEGHNRISISEVPSQEIVCIFICGYFVLQVVTLLIFAFKYCDLGLTNMWFFSCQGILFCSMCVIYKAGNEIWLDI